MIACKIELRWLVHMLPSLVAITILRSAPVVHTPKRAKYMKSRSTWSPTEMKRSWDELNIENDACERLASHFCLSHFIGWILLRSICLLSAQRRLWSWENLTRVPSEHRACHGWHSRITKIMILNMERSCQSTQFHSVKLLSRGNFDIFKLSKITCLRFDWAVEFWRAKKPNLPITFPLNHPSRGIVHDSKITSVMKVPNFQNWVSNITRIVKPLGDELIATCSGTRVTRRGICELLGACTSGCPGQVPVPRCSVEAASCSGIIRPTQNILISGHKFVVSSLRILVWIWWLSE